jgi:hypothetical protein
MIVPNSSFRPRRASGGESSNVFTTSFPATENPLLSPWIAPQAAGFTVVRSLSGHAFGTNGVLDTTDDSYAYLSGFDPASHECELIVYRQGTVPAGITHEIELHVGMSDSAGTGVVKSYEALFGSENQFQLMKWNGTMGPSFFAELTGGVGPGWNQAPAHGDRFRLRKVNSGGNVVLTVWAQPVGFGETQIYTVTDNGTVLGAPHLVGQPGIAFFNRPGANNANYGADSYTARNV